MPGNAALQESLNRLRSGRPRHLLFLCVANSARSQLAEGIACALAPAGVRISSAGSHPGGVHPLAIRVMDEIGIDIRDQWSKGIEEIDLETVDAVVTLCAPEECPVLPSGALREDWALPDPVTARSTPLDGFRALRDELQRRMSALFGDKGP